MINAILLLISSQVDSQLPDILGDFSRVKLQLFANPYLIYMYAAFVNRSAN